MKLLLSPHNDDEALFASYTLLREKPLVVIVTDGYIQYERRGKYKEKNDLWYQVNKDRLSIVRTSRYKASPKARLLMKSLNSRWYKNNPDKAAVRRQARRSRLANATGSYTQEQWTELKQLFLHFCSKCLRREPEILLTIDHKIPLAKGGTNDIDNIQPLCKSCNCSKRVKIWFASWPLTMKTNVLASVS